MQCPRTNGSTGLEFESSQECVFAKIGAATSEAVQRFTAETLKGTSKQSKGCYVILLRLRRAIKKYIQDQEDMKRKVSRLLESFNAIKDVNLQLTASNGRELIEDSLKSVGCSKRWKVKISYGDIGLKYRDNQTIGYVASRMPLLVMWHLECQLFSQLAIESSLRLKEVYLVFHRLECWILGLRLELALLSGLRLKYGQHSGKS